MDDMLLRSKPKSALDDWMVAKCHTEGKHMPVEICSQKRKHLATAFLALAGGIKKQWNPPFRAR